MRWQRDVLLPLLTSIGTVAWLGIWVRLAGQAGTGTPIVSYGSLLFAVLTGMALMRFGQVRALPLRTLRPIVFAGALIAGYLAPAIDFGVGWPSTLGPFLLDPLVHRSDAIIAMLIAWLFYWRGLRLGERVLDSLVLEDHFRLGIAGLLVMAAASPAIRAGQQSHPVLAELPGSALLFFFAMLSALSVSRLRVLQARTSSQAAPRWLLTFAGTTAAVLAVGLLIIALLPGPLMGLATLLSPLFWLLSFLDPIILFLLRPFAFIIEAILLAIMRVISAISFLQINQPDIPTEQDDLERLLRDRLSDETFRAVEWTVVLIALAIGGFLLWRMIQRRRQARESVEDELRESVWTWRELLAPLLALWTRLKRRFAPPKLIASVHHERPISAEARTVRELYRAFLERESAIGNTRRPDQTPAEFLAVAAPGLGDEATSATELTDAYVAVRYGPHPNETQHVTRARAAWQRLRVLLSNDGEKAVRY